MKSLIFNNLSDGLVARLMQAYTADAEFDPTQNPSVSLSAQSYLAALDNPAVGADNFTTEALSRAAEVGEEIDAAAAFTGGAEQIAEPEPIITKTPKMGAYTLQEMYEAGHTNESLAAEDYITITYPAAAAPAPAPKPTAPAPSPKPNGAAPAASNGGSTDGVVTLDKDGIPWDERIHSGGRTQTGAGKWSKRKNLADGVYETITEELRAAGVKPFTPLNQTAPAPIPRGYVEPAAKAAPAPPAKAPAPASSKYPESLEGEEKPFATLCKFATDPANRISAAKIIETSEQFGAPGLGHFAKPEFESLQDSVYQAFRNIAGV